MSIIIKDGTGTGHTAKVNKKGRIFTNTIQISDETAKAEDGDAYLVDSGDMTLTTDSESAVFYLKNNEERDLVVSRLAIALGFTTGGAPTGLVIAKVLRNPIVGTIVSDAVKSSIGNKNFGSSNTLSVDAFSGGEGKTLTGGTVLVSNRAPAPSLGILETPIVIPRGSSIGISIVPSTGNTSMLVATAIDVHLDGFDD